MTKTLDPHTLAQFTGTAVWHRHGLVRTILFTDGAKYVADHAGAYWLLDEIALANRFLDAVKLEEFQVWTLTVRPGSRATLTCEDGNGGEAYAKELAFTDFPEPGITLWFSNNVILLPSEY